MPRGLVDLPVELVLSIIELACEDVLSSTIRDLLLVNRFFYRLVLPFLYQSLSDEEILADLDGSSKLLFTLLFDDTKKDLVHTVEIGNVIHFSESEAVSTDADSSYTEEMQAEIHQLVEVILKYEECNEKQEQWKEYFLNGPREDAFLFLALMRLPHLKHLEAKDTLRHFWRTFGFVYEGLLSASKHPESGITRPFVSLETVTLGGEGDKWPHDTEALTIVAKWPSVKEIVCSELGDGDNSLDEDPNPSFLELVPRSTNITSITFRPACKLLSEHLVRYLGSIKALEYLDYEIGHAWAWIPFSTTELSRALHQQKDTLKSLTLELFDMELDNENNTFTSMNFSSYTALEHLDIAYDLLFIYDPATDHPNAAALTSHAEAHLPQALPESLKTLTISQVILPEKVHAIYRGLNALLGRTSPSGDGDAVPHLRSVKIAAEHRADAIGSVQLDVVKENGELYRRARERGMEFLGVEVGDQCVNGLELFEKQQAGGGSVSEV